MSKRQVVQRQFLRLIELITCVMSSNPQLKASSRLPFPLCLQETATLSKSWTAPRSTTCTTGTWTSTLPPSLHTDGQKVQARLVPPDRAISGVVHDPPPREDLRPGPPAAEFVHPYAEVLQLRHRQRLSHHGGAISPRRPWARHLMSAQDGLKSAPSSDNECGPCPELFSLGEKCEKPLAQRHQQHQREMKRLLNPVQENLEDLLAPLLLHDLELECQRSAQRAMLLNSVLGENLEDLHAPLLHLHPELECRRSARQ